MIAEEAFGSSAHNRLGHHGLFFDRLDASAPSAALAVNVRGLYHNRNRSYDPRLGRFTSADPNGCGSPVLASAVLGSAPSSGAGSLDAGIFYSDGMNLYGYLGSSPTAHNDAMGLEWDPFDMVDEFLAESAGSRLAFLNPIVGTAHSAAFIAANIASWSGIPIVDILGEEFAEAIGEPAMLLHSEWYVNLKLGARELEGFVNILVEMQSAALETAVGYAQQFGARGVGMGSPSGLGSQALQFAEAGGLTAAFAGGLSVGQRNTDVYAGYVSDRMEYFGTSRNFPNRKRQHGKRFEMFEKLTKNGKVIPMQALAIETALIERHSPRGPGRFKLQNLRRSISPTKAFYYAAMDWAREWIKKNAREYW